MPAEWAHWRKRLVVLCDELRAVTREALAAAQERGPSAKSASERLRELSRPVAQGAGDLTFGLDVPAERCIERWARSRAREGPLSVLTEDQGWLHLGPDPAATEGWRALSDFDHGGPRIAFDPIDGTRNLMAELRSAWTVVAFAPPGPRAPRQRDVTGGIVSEIPTRLAARFRRLCAERGGPCSYEELELAGTRERRGAARTLRVDSDDRPDHGYLPVFRYKPDQRPLLARLEAAFFRRLERHEGADLRSVYDDQYISNAGQLVLIALGTYRALFDARALLAERLGEAAVTAKPYDVSGAIVCAEAAGAEVTTADGLELDFPLDASTPVHFAGYANRATRARLEPHWLSVLRSELPAR